MRAARTSPFWRGGAVFVLLVPCLVPGSLRRLTCRVGPLVARDRAPRPAGPRPRLRVGRPPPRPPPPRRVAGIIAGTADLEPWLSIELSCVHELSTGSV